MWNSILLYTVACRITQNKQGLLLEFTNATIFWERSKCFIDKHVRYVAVAISVQLKSIGTGKIF